MNPQQSFNPCFIIPAYNHPATIGDIIAALEVHQLPCILVDDGCDASTQSVHQALSKQYDWVTLVRHSQNKGKGAAVKTALHFAYLKGYSHAFQIDADGQHDLEAVERFLHVAEENPSALVVGYPLFDASVPKARYYGRYATHIWVWINSFSLAIKDSMCGFRVYPVTSTVFLLQNQQTGNRMEFDSEVLVRSVWRGQQVINLPTQVSYPADGVSHFQLKRDNVLITWMHFRCFWGMVWRLPSMLVRRMFKGIKRRRHGIEV